MERHTRPRGQHVCCRHLRLTRSIPFQEGLFLGADRSNKRNTPDALKIRPVSNSSYHT